MNVSSSNKTQIIYSQPNRAVQQRKMMLCKILVVGNAKCGKTSLIRRFSSNSYDPKYTTTIGTDFVRKDVELNTDSSNPHKVRMQLWDIAGQDRFAKLTRAYFRNAKAAVIVCDMTREGTLEAVTQWKSELDKFAGISEHDHQRVKEKENHYSDTKRGGEIVKTRDESMNGKKETLPVMLFANKCDLLTDAAASFEAGAKMEALCRELGLAAWFITSAKDGMNVDKAFHLLASHVYDKQHTQKAIKITKCQTNSQTTKSQTTKTMDNQSQESSLIVRNQHKKLVGRNPLIEKELIRKNKTETSERGGIQTTICTIKKHDSVVIKDFKTTNTTVNKHDNMAAMSLREDVCLLDVWDIEDIDDFD